MRKQEVDLIIEKLVTIADWAVSCKTFIQLDTVKKCLDELNISTIYGTKNARLTYNVGYVDGIIKLKEHYLKPEEDGTETNG